MLDLHDDAMESANHNMLTYNDRRKISKLIETLEKTSHRYLLTQIKNTMSIGIR